MTRREVSERVKKWNVLVGPFGSVNLDDALAYFKALDLKALPDAPKKKPANERGLFLVGKDTGYDDSNQN